MLEETLSILAQEQVKGLDEAKVFLPDDLERMERMIGKRAHERAVCRYDCVNMDAFALARRLRQAYPQEKILVLNLANPFEPGGGERRGAYESGRVVSIADGNDKYNAGVVVPIISEGDTIGSVVFVIKDGEKPSVVDGKLAETAAGFLGKHMEG